MTQHVIQVTAVCNTGVATECGARFELNGMIPASHAFRVREVRRRLMDEMEDLIDGHAERHIRNGANASLPELSVEIHVNITQVTS